MDTICALAVAMGADFAIFVPSVRKPMLRHHIYVGHLSETCHFFVFNTPYFLVTFERCEGIFTTIL